MLIVQIQIHVKPEFIEEFKRATIENGRHSRQEPGIARFDFMQQSDAPERFLLTEVYRSPEANELHRETEHYRVWRDAVANMMAEERVRVKYTNIFPGDLDW